MNQYFCAGIVAFFAFSFRDFPSPSRAWLEHLALIRSSALPWQQPPQPKVGTKLETIFSDRSQTRPRHNIEKLTLKTDKEKIIV